MHLGIPAEQTERIIAITRKQTAVYETDNGEAFISLSVLLNIDVPAPHGLILKNLATGTAKTMLLAPRIDIDLEIPEEGIQQMPKAISGMFRYIRGVYFNDNNAIFILNLEKLIEVLQ
jgi:hypothetical protein